MVGGGLHSRLRDPDPSHRSLASLLLRVLLELNLAESLFILGERILRLLALVLPAALASGQSRSLSSGSPTASGAYPLEDMVCICVRIMVTMCKAEKLRIDLFAKCVKSLYATTEVLDRILIFSVVVYLSIEHCYSRLSSDVWL